MDYWHILPALIVCLVLLSCVYMSEGSAIKLATMTLNSDTLVLVLATLGQRDRNRNDPNRIAHIRLQCRKTAVLICHRFLIKPGVEKMALPTRYL
jgi:hypothetical protein